MAAAIDKHDPSISDDLVARFFRIASRSICATTAAPRPHRRRDYAGELRPLTIVRRVEALGSFLDTEDGKNLLAGTKRAANILAAEEKKGTAIAGAVDPALFRTDEEKSARSRR